MRPHDEAPVVDETLPRFAWRILKAPLSQFSASPLAQSMAAVAINFWCLGLAVLAQFWVILSLLLLLAQFGITWSVARRRLHPLPALLIGVLLVGANVAALYLAVLGQFWVLASLVLSLWQFVCLIRVCSAARGG